MPRSARVVIPGTSHHVTQRGNNREDVFHHDDDRRAYVAFLRAQSRKYGLQVLGWCLMGNHVHLVVRPLDEISLARTLGRAHLIYAQYYNQKYERSGHLWQNRYYSCPLGPEHFWRALRYIEQNPLRAGLIRRPWDYEWSSAAAHAEGRDEHRLIDLAYWREASSELDWRQVLSEEQDEDEMEAIRRNTYAGYPLGDNLFVEKLETRLHRRLRPLARGRPKKNRDEK
jgi:putative transposase